MSMMARSMRGARHRVSRFRIVLTGRLVSLAIVSLVGGCSNIEPVPPEETPITDPTQLYMSLTLDHPALNLSTVDGYNTQQLTAIPRDALGHAMLGLPAPSYKSSDTTKVRVTPDGLITAVEAATGVTVSASLTAGPVTHSDVAYINVTDLTPPVLASLSIHPVPPDSAIWGTYASVTDQTLGRLLVADALQQLGYFAPGSGTHPQVAPRVLDAMGQEIAGLEIVYTSLDSAVATVDRLSGTVTVIRAGQVHMVAQTTAYGVTKADTVLFTTTLPMMRGISIVLGPTGASVFQPSEVRIRPYGYVAWSNYLEIDSVDVTFDDPTQVASPGADICTYWTVNYDFGALCGIGNVMLPIKDFILSHRVRQFPFPGSYAYHSARLGGITGRIIVTAEP